MRVSYTCHINGIGVCMAKGPPRHPPPNRLPLKPPELSCICAFIAAAGLPPTPPLLRSGPGGRVGTATKYSASRAHCSKRSTHTV